MNYKEVLVRAFKALCKEDRKRLKFHLDNDTPIFCGPGADHNYFNAEGHA